MPTSRSPEFAATFELRHRALERARRLRASVSGLSVGLAFGALTSATLRFLGAATWGLAAGIAGAVLGALAGFLFVKSRRLTPEDAALFFDATLGTRNEVSAALTPLLAQRKPSDVEQLLQEQASTLLLRSRAEQTRPAVFLPVHWGGLAAAAALAWVCTLPTPLKPEQTRRPGGQAPRLDNWVDLASFEDLRQLPGLKPSRANRMDELKLAARQLDKNLAQGMPAEKALREVTRLQDAVTAEAGELGNTENRPGLAAALDALQREPTTRAASRALANGDLVGFDEEMKRLAATQERAARSAAKNALRRALQASRQQGAPAVEEELSNQLEGWDERAEGAAQLRRLASELSGETNPAPASKENLAETPTEPTDSLPALPDREKKRLAAQIQQGLQNGRFDFAPETRLRLEELARQTPAADTLHQPIEHLQSLTQPGEGAKRQKALTATLQGLRETRRRVEQNAGGSAKPNLKEGNPGAPAPKTTPSTPSPGRGGRVGQHGGSSQKVEAEVLLSRSEPDLDLTQPLPASVRGRAPGLAGESSRRPPTAAGPTTGEVQLQGVERAPIPVEYREQVSRYFSPE